MQGQHERPGKTEKNPDTFGSVTPNTNPSGLGVFNYNLRFAGMYSLAESGLFYNYFRNYDGVTGRYVESDPLRLRGGLNTYAYAGDNPISNIDPRGLVAWKGTFYTWGLVHYAYGASHYIFTLTSACVNNQQMIIKVSATAFGYGVGLLPWSNTGGAVDFEDGRSSLDPTAFNGEVEVDSVSIAAGLGYSWASYSAGSAKSPFAGGAQAGVDASASLETGDSHVTAKIGPFCCSN